MKKIFFTILISGILGLVLSLFVIDVTLAAADRGQYCDGSTPCKAGLTCGENSRCNDSTKRAADQTCYCNAECQSGNCEWNVAVSFGRCVAGPAPILPAPTLIPGPGSSIGFENPLGDADVEVILGKIAGFLKIVAFALVPIMAIIAGFMFLTAGGEPEKIKKARDLLFWMAIGVVVILVSSGIVGLIKKILLQEE